MNSKELYLQDIDQLSALAVQFLNKDIPKAAFKKASGGLGVYAEDCATRFMTRIRIPSGIISKDLFSIIYDWAREYQLDTVHLTTRQTIQFHSLTHEQMIDLLKKTVELDMPTKGAGGNFPRNVAVSPLSGVTSEEPFDVIPYSLLVNKYFEKRMFTYKLPRKLKVSFSNDKLDSAHCTIQDMGFVATLHEGQPYFRLYLGGGLGRNYRKALIYPELISAEDILYYVEAIVQFFIEHGNYENAFKARLRYLVETLGESVFMTYYQTYVQKAFEGGNLSCKLQETSLSKEGIITTRESSRLIAQKQYGLYSVYVHPKSGQLPVTAMQKIIDTLQPMDKVEIHLAMEEGMYILNLTGPEAETILDLTEPMTGHTQLSYSVACIGKPLCQMGVLQSQKLIADILHVLNSRGYTQDILPSIHVSGCLNSCGTHQISSLGFMGGKKLIDGEAHNVYQVYAGGHISADQTILGELMGSLQEEAVPDFMCWLYEELLNANISLENWLHTNSELFKSKLIKD